MSCFNSITSLILEKLLCTSHQLVLDVKDTVTKKPSVGNEFLSWRRARPNSWWQIPSTLWQSLNGWGLFVLACLLVTVCQVLPQARPSTGHVVSMVSFNCSNSPLRSNRYSRFTDKKRGEYYVVRSSKTGKQVLYRGIGEGNWESKKEFIILVKEEP